MNADTTIDLAWLESATLEDFKAILRMTTTNPQKLAEVNALLATPEGKTIASEMLNDPDYVPRPRQAQPSPEEAAQIAADTARAEQEASAAEAARLAAEAQPVDEVVVPVPPVVEEKKKIVIDYQVTAEDNTTPIGRRTHIEGWTWEEVKDKLIAAHINAVRYAERVKKSRVQSVESQTVQNNAQQQVEQAQKEADLALAEAQKDPTKLSDAIRKVSKADRDAEEARLAARKEGEKIANLWLDDHKEDFLPCQANTKIIGDWLKENNLVLSYENLELAYKAKETQLAKPAPQAPVEEVPAAVASNTLPAAPAAPAAPAPPIPAPAAAAAASASIAAPPASQPAATVSESTPAVAANTAPPARRPGVNGGIAPGTLSAQRPQQQQQPQTTTRAELLKEMKKMPNEELRRKLKNTEYVAKLRAAGIPVASNV